MAAARTKAHGRMPMYRSGCRCEPCIEAGQKAGRRVRERAREVRELARQGLVEATVHGSSRGYNTYLCRCAECSQWFRTNRKAKREKERIRGGPADKNGTPWTQAEDALLSSAVGLTSIDLARQLGRTPQSVQARMALLRSTESCRVDGCDEPVKVYAAELCHKHYRKLQRYGDPLASGWATFEPKPCEHCGETMERHQFPSGPESAAVYAKRRFCSTQCRDDAKRINVGPCAVEGCSEPSRSRGWCGHHYGIWRRKGDPEADTRRHGAGLFRMGCRCEVCREGIREARRKHRARVLQRIADGEAIMKHGRASSYSRGCRCDDCRVAWADYRREHMAESEVAREAAREYSKQRYEQLQDDTSKEAHKHFYEWTGPELELVTRRDLTLEQLAKMLGRTHAAVATARYRAEHEPKYMKLAGTEMS